MDQTKPTDPNAQVAPMGGAPTDTSTPPMGDAGTVQPMGDAGVTQTPAPAYEDPTTTPVEPAVASEESPSTETPVVEDKPEGPGMPPGTPPVSPTM